MRLFTLRRGRKGPLVEDQFGDPIYFDNKMDAKILRDRFGGDTVVALGPDHKNTRRDTNAC
jgi:hypothetical protein